MRVIAVATAAFADATLDALHAAADIELAAVVTKPDRPRGRGLKFGAPPAKEWARAHGVDVFQPQKLSRAEVAAFPELELWCDLLVVVASAFYVPSWLRREPRLGAVNIHPSLLPALRGPAPVNWAIINGLAETGVSTMRLADEMDAGDILMQEAVAVGARETAGSLAAKLAGAGARLLLETARALDAGELTATPQNAAAASYAPKITAEVRTVDWEQDAAALDRLVRGLSPTPGARSPFRGGYLGILESEAAVGRGGGAPGTVERVAADGLTIACGAGALKLVRVKPAGRPAMSAHAFALGQRLSPGTHLGQANG